MKKSLLTFASVFLTAISSFATDLISIRSMYSGTPLALPAGTIITGTITSDRSGFNTPPQSAIIQDNSGGICLRSDVIHVLNMNDSISIDVSGDTLAEFNGLLQVSHVDLTTATLLGTGTVIPMNVSISEILNNMNGPGDTWESMLVKISSVTITNDSTGIYGGSDTLTDSTGIIITFTRSAATFASATLPVGVVNLTGYITEFLIPEVIIRNLGDVQINPSVAEHDLAAGIQLFPNPAGDFFTVSMEGSSDQIILSISDITGQLIYTGEASGLKELKVSTEKFAEGMYFVQVRAGESASTRKLVIAR